MSKFPLQDRNFTEFIQKHFIHRYLGVIVCEMLTLLQCPWSSHRVVHMSNWMNYRPNSILRFWSYRQMTHLTRNPPISIRLAEKSKFRKWNVHNVTHHNGSDDQNIAGKYSIDNLMFEVDQFLKSLKFSRSNGDRKEVEFWPLTPEIIDSFQFIWNKVI